MLETFMIGKDSRGHWIVRDQQGLCGGLFINRAEAVKFAMFERKPGLRKHRRKGGSDDCRSPEKATIEGLHVIEEGLGKAGQALLDLRTSG